MNNAEATRLISECETDLNRIEKIIEGLGPMSNVVPYLTKYAIIKSCGSIEQSFKTIVADYCSRHQSNQIKNYIDITFRESSMNPKFENICGVLKQFDPQWNLRFKSTVKALTNSSKVKLSLKSLNESRNEFAHGGNPTASFSGIKDYFLDSVAIITVLDDIFQ